MVDNTYFLVNRKMITIILFDFKKISVIEVNDSCKNNSENIRKACLKLYYGSPRKRPCISNLVSIY